VADFNRDGILDVAAVSFSTNTVQVFLGNGNGSFSTPLSFPVDINPFGLAVGDFNGDGFPDLATANFHTSGDVSVLINAADWSSPAGNAVLHHPGDPSANEVGSSTPTQSLAGPLPTWASGATNGILAASTSEAAGLSSSRLERGVGEDSYTEGTDLLFSPEDLLWASLGWPLG
jgi:hypothetical protein